MTNLITKRSASSAPSKKLKKTIPVSIRNTARKKVRAGVKKLDRPMLVTMRSGPDAFRTLRVFLGLTQQQVRYLAGVSVRKISGLETGEQKPTSDDVRRFNELSRLTEELSHIIASDAIPAWLDTPNDYFGGVSPVQIIRNGESDRIWRLIWRLKDNVPLD